jgi:NhaA family Na+:H+ antiporter
MAAVSDGRDESSIETAPARWSASERTIPKVVVQPLQRFMAEETAGGFVMLAAALVALVWANSPAWQSYVDLWSTPIVVEVGSTIHLDHTLQEWINDALMVVFFFLVAIEIKRERTFGELRDPRKAAMPVIAAVGGMVVPALIFTVVNAGGPGADGWGIPVATDIAFAVAIVTLAGKRVPSSGKIFLLTLAVADDLGGIVVIALFYNQGLAPLWLVAALVGLLAIAALNRNDVRSLVPYLALGGFVWFATLESGVHATIAGVAVGLLVPTRAFYDPVRFSAGARPLVDRIQATVDDSVVTAEEATANAADMEELVHLAHESLSPMDRIAHALEPWVAFFVVPVFALANAGVRVVGGEGAFDTAVIMGVALGLLVGKPIGVLVASWIAVRTGVGRLPSGANWRHMAALGVCAGIGFTVALFVTTLSFDDPTLTDSAKIGVLVASLAAGLIGFVALRAAGPSTADGEAAGDPDPARESDPPRGAPVGAVLER